MIKQNIDSDLKTAMLAGDKDLVTTLRTVKSAILAEEVASGKRETGLDDETATTILMKESKKRKESADIYAQSGDKERADNELREVEVISKYLPDMMTEEDIIKIAKEVIDQIPGADIKQMGQIIGQVKSRAGALAEGSLVAKVVKELLG